MKKLLLAIATGLFTITMATGAMAEQKEQVDVFKDNKLVKSVVFIQGKSEYFVNGQTPGIKMDAAPYISQSRTFVPVRYLGNALGVTDENIAWDTAASKAKLVLGSKSAELTIGQKQILANGQAKSVDVAPELMNSRTYLPARFVAEALGYQVEFVDGLVVCFPEGTEKPDLTTVKQYLNTKILNGYKVPNNPSVTVEELKEKQVEITIGIVIPNRDVAKQCDEAEQILASKLGADFAKKVVDIARTKTQAKVQLGETLTGPNGEAVRVISSWGSPVIGITVWSKEAN